MFVINLTHHCVAPLPKGEGRKICLINALIDVTLLGGTRGPALQVCATLMLLCFMYCLFRTAEDVCPYDLCLFRCLVVDIALRRDARPRPTGLCRVSAVVFYVLPFSDSRGRLSLRFVPLLLPCGRYCLSAGREAPPYRFVRYRTHYPHSNQLFIIHQRSDFIIHHSSFIIFFPSLRFMPQYLHLQKMGAFGVIKHIRTAFCRII